MATNRRALLGLAALAALPAGARAQPGGTAPWPARPVRIVVPFTPGGTTDIMARVVADGLAPRIGQPVVVENLSGANGNIGAAAVARAAPDGHTLMLGTPGPLAVNRYIYRDLPYDARTAFTPIIALANVPNVVMVNPRLPIRSVADLLVALRARPGEVRFGSPGVGASGHMTTELFMAATGTRALHAPYRGSQPMLTDLAAGSLDFSIDQLTSAIGLIRGGAVRALAVSTPARSPQLPDVPTLAELGVPVEVTVWFALVGPAHLPDPVIDRLNREVAGILAAPEVVERLATVAAVPAGGSPAALRARIDAEATAGERAVRLAGIVAQ